MRKSVLALCCLLLLAAAPAVAGEDHPFFDLANCEMCKNLMEDPNLMPNLGWENTNISNGMMTITTFKTPEAKTAYDAAATKMHAVGTKMMSGEEVHLCGFCKSMKGLMMEGATHENVEFEGGIVTLVTADKTETVKHIHAHCDKINEEMKKMMQMEG